MAAEKADAKFKKPKGSAKKSKSSYYETADNGIKRLRRACPKCGSGIFMAEHKDRFACGKCSYTEWKQR